MSKEVQLSDTEFYVSQSYKMHDQRGNLVNILVIVGMKIQDKTIDSMTAGGTSE
uniref:Uncharacterized protein n=1 Tax=Arundo donax TaxID=35708 RepID=A0A0A9DW99_ARUDO